MSKRLIFSFLFILFLGIPTSALASRESLTISPLRQDIKLVPGQTSMGSIKLKNSGDVDFNVDVYAANFTVKNEAYDQEFDQPNNPLSASNWFRFDQTKIHMPANSSQLINYQIKTPPLAEPGGHYVAIFAQIEPSSDTNKDIVQIKRVASLFYFEVAGQLVKSARFTDFRTPFWQKRGAIPATLRIEDTGNTHYSIDGWVRLKTIWNSELSQVRVHGLLLPGTIRSFKTTLKSPRLPGIYKLQADMRFADQTKSVKSTWVVVFPIFWLICFSILLFIAVIWLVRKYLTDRRSHRYKQKKHINQS